MRKAIIAAAAACMVMGGARADTEPTNFVRIESYVVTATGAVKAIFEIYDWMRARWFPPPQQFQAGDLCRCNACEFPPSGGVGTPLDDSRGKDFKSRPPWRPRCPVAEACRASSRLRSSSIEVDCITR